jgi:MFS family permease
MSTTTLKALEEPTRPVSLRFQFLLGLANAGAVITLIPILIVLIPAQVTQIDPLNTASSLALVLGLGAAGAMIGNPLVGALSDRTTSPLGRRRPWLLVGMAGAALGLFALANSHTILWVALAWFTVQFFGNALISAYGAVIPDHVPVPQRGTTQAVIGLSVPIAVILSDLLFIRVTDFRVAYYLVIGVMVCLTLLFVLRYHEPQLPHGVMPPFRMGAFLASFWVSPRKFPRFGLAWLAWLLVWSAYNLGTGGFFFLYVQNITRYASLFPGHEVKEGIATIQILQIAIGVPLMMAAGVLSDRIGKRKGFVMAGIVLIGLGLVILAGLSGWPAVLVASVTIGTGFWIFYSLGLAMISQMLPAASDRGKDLGVINIAATLPQIVIPFIGAAIVNNLGAANPTSYQVLFITGTGTVVAALFMMRAIQEDKIDR